MRIGAAIAAVVLLCSGAAFPAALGPRIAERAEALVGHGSLREVARGYSDDCSGMVRYLYANTGIELLPARGDPRGNLAAAIYRHARSRGLLRRHSARPGDLIFFHDTYGPLGAGVTHIGIVTHVAGDGRITFVHRTHAGIIRSHLDLRHPRLHRDRAHRVHNDVLRRASRARRAYGAGELLADFATPRRPI